jgi:hypothetical protein
MIARRALRTALWAAAVGGLATAAAWSVRLARADAWFQTETVAGTEKGAVPHPRPGGLQRPPRATGRRRRPWQGRRGAAAGARLESP